MVKISIKKGKKTIKPKQKQKQKQSQKVIVNIGSSYKPKRRTATGRALENNKAVNKSSTTSTPIINVPQSNPLYKQPESQAVLGELLKYLKDTGVKEKEKNNELEKDKIKEKKSVIPVDEEIAQVQFTTVDNQNISGISSGLATPQFNPLSTPLNFRALQNELGALIRHADLEGENPNTGRVSLSTYNPINLSSSSSIISEPDYIDDHDSILSYESRQPLLETPYQNSLINYLQNKLVEPEPQQQVITEPQQELIETETQGKPLEIITNEPAQQDAIIIDTPEPEKAVYEEAEEAMTLIDQALKPTKEPESKQAEEPIKKTESKRAEEPPPMIEIKSVDAPRTPPPYTKDQINKMKVKQIGDIITAEKIKDNGISLVYDEERGRVFRKGQKGQQINLSDLRPIVLSHYGIADL